MTGNVASSLVLVCPAMSSLTQCCLPFTGQSSVGGSNLGRLQPSPAWGSHTPTPSSPGQPNWGSQPALSVTLSSSSPPALDQQWNRGNTGRNHNKSSIISKIYDKNISVYSLLASHYQNTHSHSQPLIRLKLSYLSSPLFLVTRKKYKCSTALG